MCFVHALCRNSTILDPPPVKVNVADGNTCHHKCILVHQSSSFFDGNVSILQEDVLGCFWGHLVPCSFISLF